MGLYDFKGQKEDGTVNEEGKCAPQGRAYYDSERWAWGFFKLTNGSGGSAGVLTLAAGSKVRLFQFGMGEDASGAGFPAAASSTVLNTVHDTNVHKNNGLNGVSIRSCGLVIGEPCTLSAAASSGTTVLTIGGDIALDGYRDEIFRRISEHGRVDFVRFADEEADEKQSVSYGLGSILRNPDHRGTYRDANTPNVGGLPGMPLPLARTFDIPVATGNQRPFALDVIFKRSVVIPARSTAVSGDIYVPVGAFLEVDTFGA